MPWSLNRPPLKVQEEARRQALLKSRNGTADAFLYWEEMGLGKTSTVLNEFVELRAKGMVNFLIVVTLNSFKQGWVDEATTVGVEGLVSTWPKCAKLDPKTQKILAGIIINYEALIGSGGEFVSDLLSKHKVYLAFDECHKIKNPNSAVTKWSMLAWKRARVRRGLTGTPMSGNVTDLFPQLKLGGGLEGHNSFAFTARYAKKGGFKGKQIIGIREDRIEELQELMDKHSFRALKRDWLDLPAQTWHNPLTVDMPPKLLRHYIEMKRDFVTQLENGELVSTDMVISQMLKLQQISSGFVYDAYKTPCMIDDPKNIPKYVAVSDLASGLMGSSKLLVFAHFKTTVDVLTQYLEKTLGYRPAVLRGGMDSETVARQKAEFNSTEGPDVLIAQISVGSATHTLLGSKEKPCYSTLFFENSYNMIDRMQAESRNHRKGQEFPVDYYDVVTSPIEASVVKALQGKQDIIKAIIEGVKSS